MDVYASIDGTACDLILLNQFQNGLYSKVTTAHVLRRKPKTFMEAVGDAYEHHITCTLLQLDSKKPALDDPTQTSAHVNYAQTDFNGWCDNKENLFQKRDSQERGRADNEHSEKGPWRVDYQWKINASIRNNPMMIIEQKSSTRVEDTLQTMSGLVTDAIPLLLGQHQ